MRTANGPPTQGDRIHAAVFGLSRRNPPQRGWFGPCQVCYAHQELGAGRGRWERAQRAGPGRADPPGALWVRLGRLGRLGTQLGCGGANGQ